MVERKYPRRFQEKVKVLTAEKKLREERMNRVADLPVILLASHIYPGMRTVVRADNSSNNRTLETRLAEMIGHRPLEDRNFVAMQRYSDMRGFMLNLRAVHRTPTQVLLEIVGLQRVVID